MFRRKKHDAEMRVPGGEPNPDPHWEITVEQVGGPTGMWEWDAYYTSNFPFIFDGDGCATKEDAFAAAKEAIRNRKHRKDSRETRIFRPEEI